MLVHTLCEIIEEDPNAFIHVQKDENDSLEVIFIQTSKMRSNVEKFGMVVLFDHTYKINKNRLPVSVFKVMDGNSYDNTSCTCSPKTPHLKIVIIWAYNSRKGTDQVAQKSFQKGFRI